MQWTRPPPTDLRRDVVCTWRATMDRAERLVPDGCVDVLWIEGGGDVWVCGPEQHAWTAPVPEGTRAVGARLRPGAARHLLRTDVHHIADQRLALDEVLGGPSVRSLADRLASADDPLAELCAEFRVWQHRADPWPAADDALARIATATPAPTVADLADAVGLTTRQVHRRSRRLFGYGPSVLGRLLRFQRFLHLIRRWPSLGLAGAAASAGYTDQAHLGRECRSITACTPTELLSETAATFPKTMSDPYKTDESTLGSVDA